MPEENQKPIEAILKETRQSRGIAIEAVHEATKIPLDVLKAIEEGYTVRALASPFYRKQFLKMYAHYLGIEVKDIVVAEPPPEEKPKPFKKILPPKTFETKPAGFTLTKQQKQQIVLSIGALLILFFVGKAVGFVVQKVKAMPKSEKKTVKAKDQKPVEKPKAAKKKPVEKPVEKPAAKKEEIAKEEPKKEEPKKEITLAPAVNAEKPVPKPVEEKESRIATPVMQNPQTGKLVNLTVRAKKKGWLQVKVDGTTVFQSALQKGAVENWQADEKIELTGNNIMQLELEVNGKMIGTVGRGEGRARKLIVTKDGLSVKN